MKLMIAPKLSREEIQKLPLAEQADMAYSLFVRAADGLAELGFDPAAIAQAGLDAGYTLRDREGGPIQLIRIDPRTGKSVE